MPKQTWSWGDYRNTLTLIRQCRETFTKAMQSLPIDVQAGGPGLTVVPDHINAWTDYLYRAWVASQQQPNGESDATDE